MPNMLYAVEKPEASTVARPTEPVPASLSTNSPSVLTDHNYTIAAAAVVEEDTMPTVEGYNVSMETEVEFVVEEVVTDACENKINSSRPCGIHLALNAIEPSFSKDQLKSYITAYSSGLDQHLMQDRLYLTWKGLKESVVHSEANTVDDKNSALVNQSNESNILNDFEFLENMVDIDNQDIEQALFEDLGNILDDQNMSPEDEMRGQHLLVPSTPSTSMVLQTPFPFQNSSSQWTEIPIFYLILCHISEREKESQRKTFRSFLF